MARMGMDPDVVEGIGSRLQQQGEAIRQTMSAIDGLISEALSNWEGQDATQFNDQWQSQFKPALTSAADAVNGLGQSAVSNANAQRQTSTS